jgi:hypothetical protein
MNDAEAEPNWMRSARHADGHPLAKSRVRRRVRQGHEGRGVCNGLVIGVATVWVFRLGKGADADGGAWRASYEAEEW